MAKITVLFFELCTVYGMAIFFRRDYWKGDGNQSLLLIENIIHHHP
jgi:hypothetical protein